MKGGKKYMKKNLIFGMFLLGILLMSSFAIAGITGYVLQLQRGEVAIDDNLGTTAVTSVSRDGVANVQITNPRTRTTETFFGRAGETLTTSSGAEFTIKSAESGTLFRRARAEIAVKPNPTIPIVPPSNISCNVCTKSYSLNEGEIISISGNPININYVDIDSSVLDVNGVLTADLLEGQTFELGDNQIITLEDVNFAGIGNVKLCESSNY